MQRLHEKLPYVLINHIYEIKAVLLIQRTFRENRPQSLLTSKCLTLSDKGESIEYTRWRGYTDFCAGDRVLIRMPNGKYRYGTINNVFPPKQDFKYVISLVNITDHSLYIHSDLTDFKMILLSGWRDHWYKRGQMVHFLWTTPSF